MAPQKIYCSVQLTPGIPVHEVVYRLGQLATPLPFGFHVYRQLVTGGVDQLPSFLGCVLASGFS